MYMYICTHERAPLDHIKDPYLIEVNFQLSVYPPDRGSGLVGSDVH